MTIKQKQRQLYYLGYYTGEIDGIWGSGSKGATYNFQSDNGLTPDYVFGPATEAKTIEIIRGIQEVIGTIADGLAGDNTKNATIEYQKANGLTPTGIADSDTRARIAEKAEADNNVDWWDDIKYFDKDEFKCKCGGKYCNGFPAEPKKDLIKTADRTREHFGAIMIVSSGVRCPTHNANVGGASGSRHKLGKAMDFCIKGRTANEILEFTKKQPEIRYTYAINDEYVHMDIY